MKVWTFMTIVIAVTLMYRMNTHASHSSATSTSVVESLSRSTHVLEGRSKGYYDDNHAGDNTKNGNRNNANANANKHDDHQNDKASGRILYFGGNNINNSEFDSNEYGSSDYGDYTMSRHTAVCLTGQLRSIHLTAPSIRQHVLEHLDADGFLFGVTIGRVSPEQRADISVLGSRVRNVILGSQPGVFDQKSYNATIASISMRKSFYLFGNNSSRDINGWSVKLAAMMMTRWGCLSLIRKFEQIRGKPYTTYIRMRIDTLILEPMPQDFTSLAQDHVAVIPMGEDWGAPHNLGINDRLLVGGTRAFEADASIWKSVASNKLPDKWISETAHRDHLKTSGITVVRRPLKYCLLRKDGSCKYQSELLEAIIESQPDLIHQCPLLCGNIGKPWERGCDEKHGWFGPESSRHKDPFRCKMKKVCEAGWQDKPEDLTFTDSGCDSIYRTREYEFHYYDVLKYHRTMHQITNQEM
eukprot:CAMPEP_0197538368 /NCGR_PEP_ID=MMETSP1318-20131121/59607_1 /TAXON_ID=552666 /ORGANISM="Partenskyella glossopodia, Strain RCC365" /LENGTH=468 /DNA_ID=CAMNT_0043096763 /DNA_START=593 /DNA_END=1999 /DNA_ORIENTATION=-